jgi:CspA family cold shock protein
MSRGGRRICARSLGGENGDRYREVVQFAKRMGGGRDVFVHISAVEKAGLSSLNEGQVVEYQEVPNKGRTSAENLKVK